MYPFPNRLFLQFSRSLTTNRYRSPPTPYHRNLSNCRASYIPRGSRATLSAIDILHSLRVLLFRRITSKAPHSLLHEYLPHVSWKCIPLSKNCIHVHPSWSFFLSFQTRIWRNSTDIASSPCNYTRQRRRHFKQP